MVRGDACDDGSSANSKEFAWFGRRRLTRDSTPAVDEVLLAATAPMVESSQTQVLEARMKGGQAAGRPKGDDCCLRRGSRVREPVCLEKHVDSSGTKLL